MAANLPDHRPPGRFPGGRLRGGAVPRHGHNGGRGGGRRILVAERNCLHGEILQCLYIEGLSCAECRRWLARDRRHEYAASSIYKLRDRALDRAFDAMVELGYR